MTNNGAKPPKTIAITGASGLIGKALCAELLARGFRVWPLRRVDSDERDGWNNATGAIRLPNDERADAVIHLAGEPVAGIWTEAKKRAIVDSRDAPTRRLAEHLAAVPAPPEVFICASAIGIYGNRGDEVLDEGSPAGTGFLAEIVAKWESATEPAKEAGIRVVNSRFGIVLSKKGGALAASLPAFKLGLGATLGSGSQWQSWISLSDTVRALIHILEHDIDGPVNLVAPNPVTNTDFTRALGAQLQRPALLNVPAFILRTALREAADEMLLASYRVLPKVLNESGFVWDQSTIAATFAHELKA